MASNLITKEYWQKPVVVGVIAILLLAINLFLKLFWYADVSLWLDEAFTIFEAEKPVSWIIADCKTDQNPPLYLIIVHYWIKLFGISEFDVRSLSIFASSFTPVVLFLGFRKYLGFNVVLFAALLLTFSDVHFFYANEARTFALISFLCAISFWLFFRSFYKGNYVVYILLGLVNTSMIFCHYIAVFIPIAQAFISLFFLREKKGFFKGILISNVIVLLSVVPWLRYIISAMPEEGVYWLQPPGIKQLAGLFIRFTGGKVFLGLYVLIAAVWLFYRRNELLQYLKKGAEKKFIILTLVAWIAVPVTLDLVASLKTPVFLDRYLLYSSLGFYLLLGYFIFDLPIKAYVKSIGAGILVLVFLFTLNVNITKDEDWRGAIAHLKEVRENNELVVCCAWYTNIAFTYYYAPYSHPYWAAAEELHKENIQFTNTLDSETFNSFRLSDKVYVVLGHFEDADPDGTVIKTIEKQYKRVGEESFEKIKVLEYERNDY